MCGIAGIFETSGNSVDPADLRTMTRMLRHRGPDGEGFHVAGPIGLGHRRLSILDVGPRGQQPMGSDDGRYWIVFNGEIYNFVEIGKKLETRGYSFRSRADTEVVLASFQEWGRQCWDHLNGMWAVAIWDSIDQTLVLSRDRFGIKPLFYSWDGRRLAFGSEMKAFLGLSWFPGEFDSPVMARSILNPYGLEGTEHCILKGIKRLPPGHDLEIRARETPTVTRWWRTADHLGTPAGSLREQAEEFRSLLMDSVFLRMRSDVPIAFSVSGGLDSGAVLGAAVRGAGSGRALQRIPDDWRTAYVATYPGTTSDESSFAEEIVAHLGVRAEYIEMDPDRIPDILDRLIFHCEEPQSPHVGPWFLYEAMRKVGHKVSVEGHGGDELLAGYMTHVRWARDRALTVGFPFLRAVALTGLLGRMQDADKSSAGVLRDVASATRLLLGRMLRELLPEGRRGSRSGTGFSPGDWLQVESFSEGPAVARLPELAGLKGLTRRLYEDLHDRVLPTILRDFDRYSMAHGVEVRTPFLDWRLVRYCFSLPEESLLGGGVTKRILREATRGWLPEAVRTRDLKIPYKSPLGEWWRGSLKEWTLDTVNSNGFLQADLWKGRSIQQHVENNRAEERLPAALLVFRFLTAYRLMRLFRSRKAAPAGL